MQGSKVNQKSIGLIILLSKLRDAIDIHRIISANATELAAIGASKILFGYLQMSALESIAICFCKVFEAERRNELKSIPGVIQALPSLPLQPPQKVALTTFGRKYGNQAEPMDTGTFLEETLELFVSAHTDAIKQFKEVRDTIAAHSDLKASRETLPSHAEFEALFAFALDFYQLVASAFIGVSPASSSRRVGHGLLRLFRSLGITDPKFEFEPER